MRSTHWLAISVVLVLLAGGCGKTQQPSGQGNTAVADGNMDPDGPAAATREFLEALRTGNDAKASQMLSAAAREKTASLNRNVTPPASDTARFAIGKVDYVNDDGARVACSWTDMDEEGNPKTDDAIWVLRRESEGWRIVGVGAQVFPDEPPLLLNFEDPEDMFKKQQWVREELRRRSEGAGLQAQSDEKQEKPVRR